MQDTQARELSFVIPTHRLREVGATIEEYDEHLWRNGHSVRLAVFDDSSYVNRQKYYPLLEQTRTHQPIYYVGPAEKEQFLAYLNSRLRDRRLETLVSNLFRPSYGGNRNCTLMYTLGGLMISSDDDMRPYSFVEYSPESLAADEVFRGRLYHEGENGYTRKSFDIVAAFVDVLGKRVADVPDNYERGEFLIDTAMDLETNATKGLARENPLLKTFYGFEPDFFQQNLTRIVDDVVSVIKSSIQLWPSLVEIAYFQKERCGLPQTQVNNQRK